MTGAPTGRDDRPDDGTGRQVRETPDGPERPSEGTQRTDDDTSAHATPTSNGRERAAGVRTWPGHVTADGTDGAVRPRIEVAAVDESFRASWNDLVERSPHGTPVHRYEFLETIQRHVDADLYALVGWDGDDPVGVFPLFCWRPAGLFDVAVSPPPGMGLSSLGPATITDDGPGAERRNQEFVEASLGWLRDERGPWYVHVETNHRYGDVRPFAWRGYEVTPRYTYLVDLDRSEEDLFMSFSGDARRNVRECREADCVVRTGGAGDLRRIVASVNDRYAEQGVAFSLDPAFVRDLYYSLPDGRVRPYVTEADGEFAGGMIAFEFGDTIYRWQGGTVPDVDRPVNDYLDWSIMRDAGERGLRRYDLVGANTERLCEYKAKFDPSLAAYYGVTGGHVLVRTGVRLFDGAGVLDGWLGRLRRTLLPD